MPDDFWDEATVVVPEPKEAISFRVDRDVLDWFRDGGSRYQTRMNAVLRSYADGIEVASALSDLYLGVPVLFVSGYSD